MGLGCSLSAPHDQAMSDDHNDRILAAIAGVRTDIGGVRTDIESVRNHIEAVRKDLESARNDTTQIRSALLAELAQTRAALMARMDRLQNELTLRTEDTVVNMGAAERAERIAKAAVDEVRTIGDMVTAMARQIQRLQTEVRQLRGEP
jgi:chromosome segregation ATPase